MQIDIESGCENRGVAGGRKREKCIDRGSGTQEERETVGERGT